MPQLSDENKQHDQVSGTCLRLLRSALNGVCFNEFNLNGAGSLTHIHSENIEKNSFESKWLLISTLL